MKKLFMFLLILAVIVSNLKTLSYAEGLNLSAQTAILINSDSGDVLYEKDSSKQMFPASTTKILTAIIAIENSDLDDKVTIDLETSTSADGSHIALEPGEVLSMEDLLHALLIDSANDSATAIAKHISGSVEDFAELMNQEAKKMGAKNSNFLNPSGLPNEEHLSTAYDLAMIARYAMKNDVFREIVKKTTYTIQATNKKEEPRVFNNSNKLLNSTQIIDVDGVSSTIKYKGALGIKTGYTKAAQQCLVSGVSSSNKEYITVVLHSIGKEMYVDTHKLFNSVAKDNKPMVLAKKNEFIDNISIKGGNLPFITAVFAGDFTMKASDENLLNIKKEFIPIKNLKLPISKGQIVGKVNFKSGDNLIGSADIVSENKIVKAENNVSHLLEFLPYQWWFWLLVSLLVLRFTIAIRRVSYRAKRLKMKKARKKGQTVS